MRLLPVSPMASLQRPPVQHAVAYMRRSYPGLGGLRPGTAAAEGAEPAHAIDSMVNARAGIRARCAENVMMDLTRVCLHCACLRQEAQTLQDGACHALCRRNGSQLRGAGVGLARSYSAVRLRSAAHLQGVLRMKARFLTLLAALVALLSGCQSYDVLVTKDQVCLQKWADVEAQLQRRADLIPNLVAVVRGSAKHEEQTLEQVTRARASATSIVVKPEDLEDPEKMAAFAKAQDQLKGALSRLLVVQEQYPDLKANAAFHDLQIQIEGTENRLLRAREEYNAAVGDYNAALGHVRGKVVNRLTGRTFNPRAYFSAAPEAVTAPTVSF